MENAHNLYARALQLLEQQRYEQSITLLRRALEQDPDMVEARMNLGQALYAVGKYEDAETQFEAVVRMRPDYGPGRHALGEVLLVLEKYKDAEEQLLAASRLMPEDPEVFLDLGTLFHLTGNLEQAASALRRAASLRQDHSWTRFCLAMVLKDMGRLNDALRQIEETIRLGNDSAPVLEMRSSLRNSLKHSSAKE